ncbi:DM13 domain-containing protein [Veronia pacifica]|uniref:DM13 domain-containing protein n=1 Tax=Veronia pacifica TaxID=1080227 RepID=A0A1C3ESL9_9GAMM|nr:DM13 domain-containing protein [Veronia pacifica]ODA36224.1 hypothetical protein A8L45_01065 [Veronia pacifica]
MKKTTIAILTVSHSAMLIVGFALGIYALPILIAPPAPDGEAIEAASAATEYSGKFERDRIDSDNFHWGEGDVSITDTQVVFSGELAPGPDYYLYFSPQFIETEEDFNRLKTDMLRAGNIKTFDNFIVDLPDTIDPSKFNTVIVWCETFGEFITSAQYTPYQ